MADSGEASLALQQAAASSCTLRNGVAAQATSGFPWLFAATRLGNAGGELRIRAD